MKRIRRRTLAAKFKAEAVKLATEQNLTPDQMRIRELERELAIAKMERDI